ncbi:DUF4145 domain-containing protein [Neptunomonas japonica]|uniref:DUF4145 domain-containing protein n=1 Tax=Neptunomonas japonica JAMM 1380 TaxID=1441457 RepID=A0A7R6PIT5_9GAMM|nr:DUF4145 domain-containing protein [Neptunomonas japonica]BBB29886.1 conserved hypothetical protein [Neptunomonas japonica JAMM 1380]
MNTDIWTSISSFIDATKYPSLPCPYCKSGEVALDLASLETRPLPDKYKEMASRHYEDQKKVQADRIAIKGVSVIAAFDEHPLLGIIFGACAISEELKEDIRTVGQCISFFECKQCKGGISGIGLAKIHQRKAVNEEQKPTQVKFEYFTPTIPMMDVSPNVPSNIKSELFDSFKHFHFDPPSAASKLRRAIEGFCKVEGAEGSNLQRQINSLKSISSEEVEYLGALKLVGNEGTHSDGVDEQDLLQAYTVFEYVLELYDRRARYQATLPDFKQITSKFNKTKPQLENNNLKL